VALAGERDLSDKQSVDEEKAAIPQLLPRRRVTSRVARRREARREAPRLGGQAVGRPAQRLALGVSVVGSPEILFIRRADERLDPQFRAARWLELVSRPSRGAAALCCNDAQMEEDERSVRWVAPSSTKGASLARAAREQS